MRKGLPLLLVAACVIPAPAQLPAAKQASIDETVQKVLRDSDLPSASIAVVVDAKPAYVHAYGVARLEPSTPATPEMRYKIASNSKQFLAAAMLMLAAEGKVSLDDPVARFLPDLTRARDVTIRQLLSHTSGYQDYYPLDYVAPFMTRATTAQGILDVWAKKPLDFEPGTKWQYSNTNYVIAGAILEKITHMRLFDFLRARIFEPLGMHSVIDMDSQGWSSRDPVGYTHYALGPPRPAPLESSGWMYAAGELAMTAGDLALWDLSLIQGSLLKPASLAALTTEVKLKNGEATGYALGLDVSSKDGHRKWAHTGGASGFLSENFTLPDDRMSVTVLTNGETLGYRQIARRIEAILTAGPADAAESRRAARSLEIARQLFRELQHGEVDRAALTDDANAYFTAPVLADFGASLGPLGEPAEFRQTDTEDRGGMTERSFAIRAGGKSLTLSTYWSPEGKIAQYLIYR